MISVNDPQARHTRKSGEARRDGYRAHVAADPDTGIITDEKLTKASGQENSDPAVAEEFVAAEAAGPDGQAGTGRAAGPSPAGSQGHGGAEDALAWFATLPRHRGPARCDRQGRAPGSDQARAAAVRGARRVRQR